jgi:hypothetical protein
MRDFISSSIRPLTFFAMCPNMRCPMTSSEHRDDDTNAKSFGRPVSSGFSPKHSPRPMSPSENDSLLLLRNRTLTSPSFTTYISGDTARRSA